MREKKLAYFSGSLNKVLQSEKKKLVYFSGSLNMKILVLKDRIF